MAANGELEKGDDVEVIGTHREFQKKYMGLKGKVSRNRGHGEFEVTFPNGEKCSFYAAMLKMIEAAGGDDE